MRYKDITIDLSEIYELSLVRSQNQRVFANLHILFVGVISRPSSRTSQVPDVTSYLLPLKCTKYAKIVPLYIGIDVENLGTKDHYLGKSAEHILYEKKNTLINVIIKCLVNFPGQFGFKLVKRRQIN